MKLFTLFRFYFKAAEGACSSGKLIYLAKVIVSDLILWKYSAHNMLFLSLVLFSISQLLPVAVTLHAFYPILVPVCTEPRDAFSLI